MRRCHALRCHHRHLAADGVADGKETRLKGKEGRQPSAGLIFMADRTAAHFHFLIVDFLSIEVLTHFPIETTGAEQMNRQLWQRHGMVHIEADAVTLPLLAIHLFCARSFYGKMREDLDRKKSTIKKWK